MSTSSFALETLHSMSVALFQSPPSRSSNTMEDSKGAILHIACADNSIVVGW